MDIQHLRHSLKVKWLLYYQKNRPWLVQLKIWGSYDGQRRLSSTYILATLSVLEPQLTELFPFIVALANNPDQIVAALGLDFDPDEELKSMREALTVPETNGNGNGLTGLGLSPMAETNGNNNGSTVQELPNLVDEVSLSPSTQASNLPAWVDESCQGKGSPNPKVVLSVLLAIGVLAVLVVGFTATV